MREIWRIVRFTKSLWRYYVGISAFTILLSVMSQLQPLFTKGAIDQITKLTGGGHANVKLVAIFAVLIFLTDVAQTFLNNIGGYLGDLMAIKQQKILSERYYEHVLSLPQAYFDTELTGKIINRMNRGIGQVSNFMQMLSNNFLQFIFSTIFTLIIVAFYSWQVALLLFLLYPIFIVLTAKTSGRWQAWQKEINEEQDVASGRFAEAIGQVRVVKSFLQEARELNFFRRRYDEIVTTTRPQSRFWHQQDVFRRLILNLIFLAVFAFIFVETARGRYSIGTMVLLIQYAMLIRIPIFSISFLVDQTQRAVANTKDYFAVMDEKPEIIDRPGAQKLAVEKGEIVFDHVRFGYDEAGSTLRDIHFAIEPDTKVGLVGESGEGKTTISNLLLRLYEVDTGEIRIDGQNINDVTQASLRANIGVVFQEPALFSGTIRENIAYAQPRAKETEIVAAAKAANADEFIARFEKGYDTEIGERGLKLSGGQKQRIAIARALLKDAPVLILDEATSSLDSKSERMVQEALERLMKGRTTLIIAHRLSTIQNVDQIITLKNGTVDEIGTPEQLAKTEGIYATLLQLQQTHTEATKKQLQKYEIAG
ncbi:MAG TPA: ABC transporter ATP-binding protein [Candidatus Saccharimonadales bacterium]|jgi:ATP-binding cassette subfamily B protein